ncbi:MAG: porphobilinogen synthase [Thermoguttaceae bacterium]|nr:porphobilinogen synthase [Thermoguttaceae bacterium]MDW8078265.1 porphobilinogen synthase [Thermoguttaceae bacterium]
MNAHFFGRFPSVRLRRLRELPKIRRLVAEVSVSPRNLVLPIFVRPGKGVRRPIPSMPGHYQLSPDLAAEEAQAAFQLGLGGIILFGIPEYKDPRGSSALRERGIIPEAIDACKGAAPELLVITDLCFCEYTSHGHCGILGSLPGQREPTVDNDRTLAELAYQAVVHARAGSDVIAPSGMMDGMIRTIRAALDGEGFHHVPILSYAAKFASTLYGPFRQAAECAPQFGDRRSYQMDPASDPGQALREVALDLEEGADMVMVKPALPYLDIIRLVRDHFPGVPVAAYQVSGEYSMLKAAASQGWLDEKGAALELLTCIRRAGAAIIITYWAKELAPLLEKSSPVLSPQ